MWQIFEGPKARKALDKLPREMLKKYEKWKDVVRLGGPTALRTIRGFNDEALRGKWFGYRSSRLSLQYRLIYRVVKDVLMIEVFDVNAHDYRR